MWSSQVSTSEASRFFDRTERRQSRTCQTRSRRLILSYLSPFLCLVFWRVNPLEIGQGVVLGVDIIGEDSADSPLASETAKEGQAPSEDEGVRQDDGGMNTRSAFSVRRSTHWALFGWVPVAMLSIRGHCNYTMHRTNRPLASCRHFQLFV